MAIENQVRLSWDEAVANARLRPLMYIGDHDCMGHFESTLRLLHTTRPFNSPLSIKVCVSPNQYVIRCDAGPLNRKFRPYLKLSQGLNLIDALNISDEDFIGATRESGWRERSQRLSRLRGWKIPFSSNSSHVARLNTPMAPYILAERFGAAVKVGSVTWCQTFSAGKPVSDPFAVNRTKAAYVVAGSLGKPWFTHLPFTKSQVAELLEREYPSVSFEWHRDDDLLTDEDLQPDAFVRFLT